MSKPTPGPWRAEQWEKPTFVILSPPGASPRILATTIGGNDAANATLIAAAPELKDRLADLVQALDGVNALPGDRAYLEIKRACELLAKVSP